MKYIYIAEYTQNIYFNSTYLNHWTLQTWFVWHFSDIQQLKVAHHKYKKKKQSRWKKIQKIANPPTLTTIETHKLLHMSKDASIHLHTYIDKHILSRETLVPCSHFSFLFFFFKHICTFAQLLRERERCWLVDYSKLIRAGHKATRLRTQCGRAKCFPAPLRSFS